jgi:hypothetical protein
MLLEARRARHGMHVVASVRVAESTSNEITHFSETTVLNDTHVHMHHNRTQHASSTRLAHMDTCTPDIEPDDHTCYIRALCALSHAHLGSDGNRRPRGGGWRAPERPQTPPDGWLLHAAS